MKFKKIMLVSLILLAILTIGAVSAADDISHDLTADDSVSDVTESSIDDSVSELAESSADEAVIGDGEPQEKTSDYKNITSVSKEVFAGDDSEYAYACLEEDLGGTLSIAIDDDVKLSDEAYYQEFMLQLNDLGLSYGPHKAKFTYTGDEKHVGFERVYSFNYNYFDYSIPENPTTSDSITVYTAGDAPSTVKILIDGKTVFNEEVQSDDLYSLSGLSLKTHNYEIIYVGDSVHKKITKKGQFSLSYPFDVNWPDAIEIGETATLSIYLPDDANSQATVTANGKTYKVKITDGEGECDISDFTIGKNPVVVKYSDSNYSERTVSGYINVIPYLDVPLAMEYKNMKNITLKLPKTAKGTLTAEINGKTYTKQLENGVAAIKLDDLTVGYYPLVVTYSGDFKDNISFDEGYDLTVKPALDIPTNMFVNGSYEIKFNAPENFSGTLRIYDNEDLNITGTVKNGKATIPLSNLKSGSHIVDVYFESESGDEYYWTYDIMVYNDSPDWNMDLYFQRTISKLGTEGENPSVSLKNIPNNLEGYFTVYIDGVKYGSIDSEDAFMEMSNSIFNLNVGTHKLTVTYGGDGYFKAQNKSVEFDVGYVTIDIPPVIMIPYDDYVSVSAPENVTGTVTVNVDGKKFKSEKFDVDSYFDIDLSGLSYGAHDIEVIYNGNYGKITKKATNVTMDYTIDLNTKSYDFVYGEDNSFTFTVPEKLKGNFEIFIDGKKYSHKLIDDEMNEYSVNFSDLFMGTYKVELKYSDNKLPSKTFTDELNINTRIIYDNQITYKGEGYVSLTLPGDATGKLYLYESNYDSDSDEELKLIKTADIKNGVAKIQLPNNEVGAHRMYASFNGSYEISGMYIEYEVKPILSVPENMAVGENRQMTVEVNPDAVGTLAISIDDEDVTPDFVNGKATISLSNLAIGDHEIYIDYQDGEYSLSDYYYIDVLGPKLVGGKDINMYYGDSKTYSLKVFDAYGKPVSDGQIVTIKIGKNTYKAKTKKGVASVKITSLPGKYTIKATYKGVTVTNKLVVKRVVTLKAVKVKKSAKKLVLTATLKKGKSPLKKKTVLFKFNGKKYKAKTNKKGVAKITVKKAVLKKLKVGKKVTYQVTYLKDTVKKSVKVKK